MHTNTATIAAPAPLDAADGHRPGRWCNITCARCDAHMTARSAEIITNARRELAGIMAAAPSFR